MSKKKNNIIAKKSGKKKNEGISNILNKKNITILVICLVIILLILLVIITSKINSGNSSSKKRDTYQKGDWKLIYGKEITSDSSGYDTKEYHTEYFNSTIEERPTKYLFSVPNDVTLHRIGDYFNEYVGSMVITYDDNFEYSTLDEYFNTYISQNQNTYARMGVSKMIVNSNIAVIDAKYVTRDDIYKEELVISYAKDNRYSYVKYMIYDDTFSDEFKKRVINDFHIDTEDAKYTFCVENGSQYNCEITIKSLGKKINYSVDAIRYMVDKKPNINNSTERFIFDGSNIVNVSLAVSGDFDNDVKSLNIFGEFKKGKVKINGKEYVKYLTQNSGKQVAGYIVPLDKNINMMIFLSHAKDNLDDIVKDFLDFKVSDIK